MAETIRDVMTGSPRTIDSAGSAVDAARLMRDEDVGLIPIVESDRLVGTVTDRDIAVRLVAEGKSPEVAEGKSPESTRVADIASRELVTIDPDQDVDEAMRLMSKHQVRRLPVVEEDGKLVGIVAQADIAKHVSAAQTGDVVEKISK